jgi:hypothetical protein
MRNRQHVRRYLRRVPGRGETARRHR